MQLGETIEVTIDNQGMSGEGVAHIDGKVVFLPYALIGEKVRATVTFVKKNFAHAKIIKVLEPSPMRVTPQCEVYFKCGGCDYLHINSSAHQQLKTAELENNFRKIAGVEIEVEEYTKSPSGVGYRNKVQLPFGYKDGKVVVGYFAEKSHQVVPHTKCFLNGDWATDITNIVLEHLNTHQISVYNETSGKGLMRHLVMRKMSGKVAIVLVINGNSVPRVDELIDNLKENGIDFNLHYNINTRDTNVIMSQQITTVYGQQDIAVDVLNTQVRVSPLSFMQVNDFIRDKIYLKVVELAQDTGILFDLYSGVGITSNILASHCKQVYSIEIVKEAVENAIELAKLNKNQGKIACIHGDACEELPKLINILSAVEVQSALDNNQINIEEASIKHYRAKSTTRTVLLDPPRKGCDPKVMETILSIAPDKIIYISCNHATLARDFSLIKDNYSITHVSAYDMFPNTSHLETLICLKRK